MVLSRSALAVKPVESVETTRERPRRRVRVMDIDSAIEYLDMIIEYVRSAELEPSAKEMIAFMALDLIDALKVDINQLMQRRQAGQARETGGMRETLTT